MIVFPLYVIVLLVDTYPLFRQPSCYSCIRVNTLKSTSDSVIEKLSSLLQVNGWQSNPSKGSDASNNVDGIATEPVVSDGSPPASLKNSFISKCKIPGLDYVVFVQGSGPHTIDYGYKEDKPPKEVIVSRKCAEAVLRGAHVSMQFRCKHGTRMLFLLLPIFDRLCLGVCTRCFGL